VRRWPKILLEADARRGIAARLHATGLAFIWMTAWAQIEVVDPDHHVPSSTHDRTQDSEPVKLPAYPNEEDLVGFFVTSASNFKFFIDRRSLSIRSDGVVRYTLVARSPQGVDVESRTDPPDQDVVQDTASRRGLVQRPEGPLAERERPRRRGGGSRGGSRLTGEKPAFEQRTLLGWREPGDVADVAELGCG